MDTLEAMLKSQAAAGAKQRVFDWDKAATLIRERQPKQARAGLKSDWEWTGGTIFEDGEIVKDSYTYLSSNWAIPELELDGDLVDCWKYADETPGWNAGTKWPESALKIVKGG